MKTCLVNLLVNKIIKKPPQRLGVRVEVWLSGEYLPSIHKPLGPFPASPKIKYPVSCS